MEMVIYKYKRKPLIPNHDPQVPMPTSKQYIFWYLCNSTCCATMDSKKNQCPTLKTVILTQQGQVCTAATMILNTAQSIPIVYENQDHPEKNNNPRDPLLSSTPVNTRLSTIHASHLRRIIIIVLYGGDSWFKEFRIIIENETNTFLVVFRCYPVG